MDHSLKRRIQLESLRASNRINTLDSLKRYEDSFALTEEFREWILCPSSSEMLNDSVLKYPSEFIENLNKKLVDSDELLEL
tara:strand:- start:198 stop:440 length:243 start_codon:yes stop_codon:yes gene_type:complete